MDDRDLARLLSGRPEPSVLEKEEVLERVLQEVAPRSRRSVTRWVWGAAAAAALALFAIVRIQDFDSFEARGSSERKPSLRVVCVETGQTGSCPAHGTLAFELDPGHYDYAALFARSPDGRVIWYFWPLDGHSLSVKPARGDPLRQGVRLGDDQPPGRYELVLVLLNSPLSRTEIKARLSGGNDALVLRQPLVVQAAP